MTKLGVNGLFSWGLRVAFSGANPALESEVDLLLGASSTLSFSTFPVLAAQPAC